MTTPADLPELPIMPDLDANMDRLHWDELQETGRCHAAFVCRYGVGGDKALFTEESMRAYGQACYAAGVRAGMERAAVICDQINSESGNGFEPFAAAIRAAQHEKQQTE